MIVRLFQIQTVQMVEHLAIALGNIVESGFVHHYFSHPVAFGAVSTPGTDRLTPCKRKEPVAILEGEDHLRVRNGLNTQE